MASVISAKPQDRQFRLLLGLGQLHGLPQHGFRNHFFTEGQIEGRGDGEMEQRNGSPRRQNQGQRENQGQGKNAGFLLGRTVGTQFGLLGNLLLAGGADLHLGGLFLFRRFFFFRRLFLLGRLLVVGLLAHGDSSFLTGAARTPQRRFVFGRRASSVWHYISFLPFVQGEE